MAIPQEKRESRQNPRLADGLGKTFGKPFIMAITLFCDGAPAKTGDRVWGNSIWKRFILAIPPRKAALTPKPATIGTRFGKNLWEPVYLGNREINRDPIGETIRISETIRIGETRRDDSCRRSD